MGYRERIISVRFIELRPKVWDRNFILNFCLSSLNLNCLINSMCTW